MNKAVIRALEGGVTSRVELREQLDEARKKLLSTEAELAREQAAVNAFRMHCRLKLDDWVNTLQALQTEKQALLTRLELLRQSQDLGIPYHEAAPFWQGEQEDEDQVPEDDWQSEVFQGSTDEEELVLPTDVPRDKAAEKRLYRELARRFHPDLGGTSVELAYRTEMMAAVNSAYAAHDTQSLYDLAGKLDPTEAAKLQTIADPAVRSLSQQILRCQQRRRKVVQQLRALRQENTARLWRKAQYLDREDTHWWEIVRQEIESAIGHVKQEIDLLQSEVATIEASQMRDASSPD